MKKEDNMKKEELIELIKSCGSIIDGDYSGDGEFCYFASDEYEYRFDDEDLSLLADKILEKLN